jgi:hypothetical protein
MNSSIVHFKKPVATVGQASIVRGHYQGDSFGSNEIEQKIEDGGAGGFIERAGGLVREQDLRLVHQCAAEGGALTLATGEFLDALIEAMSQARAVRELFESRQCGCTIDARGDGGNEAVLRKREIWNQIVELKNETDFMPEQAKQVAMAIYLSAVD